MPSFQWLPILGQLILKRSIHQKDQLPNQYVSLEPSIAKTNSGYMLLGSKWMPKFVNSSAKIT